FRVDGLAFFFQAEDGIRDRNVTGVQTCALPISGREPWAAVAQDLDDRLGPAHAVTARGDDGEREAAALDLDAQRLERLARADGEPARSHPDGEARARAPPLGLAPEPGEARRGRAGRRRRRECDTWRRGNGG